MTRVGWLRAALLLVVVLLIFAAWWWSRSPAAGFSMRRVSAPAGTEVRNSSGDLVAQLTDGARTVTLAGPSRTFTEPGQRVSVVTDRWVRLLPAPFSGVVDDTLRQWLSTALADRSLDELGIAFQYLTGAPDVWSEGIRIAGDAEYRLGADFNDYLAIPWRYGSTLDPPEGGASGALDCSGFVRLVLGYRLGLAMSIDPARDALPRRATDQLTAGPGTLVIADAGVQVTQLDQLRPGDLVFFDASTDDGTAIDHDGIYLGVDAHGDRRFISSRQGADGPTMGDEKGPSTVNGSGYWATAFRAVRRP
jgi:hypothetical protein